MHHRPTLSFTPSLPLRSLLRACARQNSLQIGKKLHATIITSGLSASPTSFLRNALLQLYASCDQFWDASKLFDEIPHSYKDTVDYTTLMGCFARLGMLGDSLGLYVKMRREGISVDDVTFVCVFNACAKLGRVEVGVQGHGCLVKTGFGLSVRACNAVMDMYVKCGQLGNARKVFEEMPKRNVVSWTVILNGIVEFEGFESGRVVFDKIPEKNEVAWTIMIAGYVENGFTREGLLLLSEMVFDYGLTLNFVSLCSFLSACSQSGDVITGKWVHAYAIKSMEKETNMNIMISTALVDMYAKCGRIKTAILVFECMPKRNVVAWNAMLSGLAMHGRGKDVLELFPKMVKEVLPDELTFISLLSACSHSGLVDEGCNYFRDIEIVYGVKPTIEHYACMVDLLGRASRFEDAENLIKKMPLPPNEVVLGSLIGSCNVHGKLHLAEHVLKELVQIDPHNLEYHILLSNMYSLAGKKKNANILRRVLKQRGIRKIPGMSFIHISGKLHQFTSGDKSHVKTREIYVMLDEMIRKLRMAGYVPNRSSQVFSGSDGVEEYGDTVEEKEQVLFSHSEKLAVCFGLISTRAGTPLYIFKNLRTCQDCHSAIKIASNIYNREIVVRDRNRFHRFRHGTCSCSDYW